MLNLPLRYVPPAMRPAVDWVALSLLVWVPIVWVMALTGLGSASPHSGAEHAEAAHHESAPAYDQKDSHTKDAEGHGGGH